MDKEEIRIYSEQDMVGIRAAGRLAAEVLDHITPFVKVGVDTESLDNLMNEFIQSKGGASADIGYCGYPKATCISPNHVICHGIPSPDKYLQNGDIVNIDVTVVLDGWYGDTSRMFYVGHPSVKAKRLVQTTYETMMAGVMAVKPGATTGDLGAAMQSVAESAGYSVVRDYCGHGCGGIFHGAPNILNFGRKGAGVKLVPGMVFTIEPMVNVGSFETMTLKDGWTVVTKDKQLSAQFEHMVAVTSEGVEILTLSPKGWNYPPYQGG
ncbi:MAG: type I methionyl aminopeptidase [Alphaproteobacteria bacterium]|nr:type I methionyl aminopeptidase [Alphaproteobacteria bacterium]